MLMDGLLYIYMSGVSKEERVKCAKEHAERHVLWYEHNLEEKVLDNFIHTNDYKITQKSTEILFEVVDIKIQFSYIDKQLVFGIHL